MSIATGGKVWSIPAVDDSPTVAKPFYHSVKKQLLILIPIWCGLLYLSFLTGKHFYSFAVEERPAFGSEYTKEIVFNANIHFLYGIILGTVGLSSLALKMAKNPKVDLKGFKTLMHLTLGGICLSFILTILGGVLFHPDKPTPFEDWAKSTYGYSSMTEVENSNELVYDAISPNGENVRVKVYEDGTSKYLYENTEQLKIVLEQVAAKKIAQEEDSGK